MLYLELPLSFTELRLNWLKIWDIYQYQYCWFLKRTQLTCSAWVLIPEHSRGRSAKNVQILSKTWAFITVWPSFLWSLFVKCLVHSNTKVKSRESSNHAQHYRRCLYHPHPQNAIALEPNVFLLEYIGYRSQRTVCFPYHKLLPRSTLYSPVTNCISSITFILKS